MSPAPSTAAVSTRAPSTTVAAAAAVVALAVHFWGLYRDHGPPTLRWFPQADKVEHLVGFGLPCFLVLLALHLHAADRREQLGARTVGLVAGLFVLHAVVSEVLQGALYTTRSGDPADTLADLVGTALGLGGYLAFRRRARTGAPGGGRTSRARG